MDKVTKAVQHLSKEKAEVVGMPEVMGIQQGPSGHSTWMSKEPQMVKEFPNENNKHVQVDAYTCVHRYE